MRILRTCKLNDSGFLTRNSCSKRSTIGWQASAAACSQYLPDCVTLDFRARKTGWKMGVTCWRLSEYRNHFVINSIQMHLSNICICEPV